MACPKCGGMIQSQFEWEYHREYGRMRYSCLCGWDTFSQLERPAMAPRKGKGRIVKLPGRTLKATNTRLKLPGDSRRVGGGHQGKRDDAA